MKDLPVGIINGVLLGFIFWMFILAVMLCSCTSEEGMSAKRVTESTIIMSGLVSGGGSQRRTEGLAHHADYDACLIEHNGVLTISPCHMLSLVRM